METVNLTRRNASDLLMSWATDTNISYEALKLVSHSLSGIEAAREQAGIELVIKTLEKVNLETQEFDKEHL